MSSVALSRQLASAGAEAPRRRRQGVGLPTFMFVAVTVFMAVGAFNGQNNLLLWLFAATVCALVVGGLVSGFGMVGLKAVARAPGRARAGEAFTVEVTIENDGLAPVFGLLVEADCVGAVAAPGTVAMLGRGRRTRVRLRVVAVGRGLCEIRSVRVSSSFPLGVVRKSLEFAGGGSVLVRPARMSVRTAALSGGRGRGGHGYARSARIGRGDEFFGLREYVPGDPLRMVAWKRSGRGSGFLVRQQSEPGSRRVWIELDLPGGLRGAGRGGWRETLLADPGECAVAAAAAACEHFAKAGRPFGLLLKGRGVLLVAGSGPAQLESALDLLATVGSGGTKAQPWIGGQRDTMLRIGPGAAGEMALDSADPGSFFEGWSAEEIEEGAS